MTQPNDSSFYVTLTSRKTQEFPNNSNTHFQYRLPQTLWLPGKWKVGLASVFLPGILNPIPHVVKLHTTTHHETKTFSTRSLQNLYKGSNTNIMFQQYAKDCKSSQSQEFLSKLNKSDLLEASTGFEFLTKVFRWTKQDLNKKLPTGYKFEDNNDN